LSKHHWNSLSLGQHFTAFWPFELDTEILAGITNDFSMRTLSSLALAAAASHRLTWFSAPGHNATFTRGHPDLNSHQKEEWRVSPTYRI
jgi:hypothetical protein